MSEHPRSIMISGESSGGKSTSLMNLKNQEKILYLNCDGGKPLPFKNKFIRKTVNDPYEIYHYYDQIKSDEQGRVKTIIVDTVSFMMDQFETTHVKTASNTMDAWGRYGDFFRTLMLDKVANSPAMTIFLGHLQADLDESTGEWRYTVPVKGSLAKKGLEAYFTTVINCKKIKMKTINEDRYKNSLLNITPRDETLGYKHVFQTLTTKETVGDRIRSPLGLFKDEETYIDNDVQLVLNRLDEYYKD